MRGLDALILEYQNQNERHLLHQILHNQEKQMATLQDLQARIDQLKSAQAAEQQRQADNDAADAAAQAKLQAAVDSLTLQLSTAGLTPDQQKTLDDAVSGVQAVIDSLAAEQPPAVAPVVPAPVSTFPSTKLNP